MENFTQTGCPFLKNILRKKSPYSELFWSVFSCIRTEYGEIRSIFVVSFEHISQLFLVFLVLAIADWGGWLYWEFLLYAITNLEISNLLFGKPPNFFFLTSTQVQFWRMHVELSVKFPT